MRAYLLAVGTTPYIPYTFTAKINNHGIVLVGIIMFYTDGHTMSRGKLVELVQLIFKVMMA